MHLHVGIVRVRVHKVTLDPFEQLKVFDQRSPLYLGVFSIPFDKSPRVAVFPRGLPADGIQRQEVDIFEEIIVRPQRAHESAKSIRQDLEVPASQRWCRVDPTFVVVPSYVVVSGFGDQIWKNLFPATGLESIRLQEVEIRILHGTARAVEMLGDEVDAPSLACAVQKGLHSFPEVAEVAQMGSGTRCSWTSSHDFRVRACDFSAHSSADVPDSTHHGLLAFCVGGAERFPLDQRLVEALGKARLGVSSICVEKVPEEIRREVCASIDLGVASLHKVQPLGNVDHDPFLCDHSLPKWVAPVTVNLVDVFQAFRPDLTCLTRKDLLRQRTLARSPEEHPEFLHDVLHQCSRVCRSLKISMSVDETLPIELVLSIGV
mmetsp:Transcript_20169/g.29277  ORF Transcript_20169/g.29277 Transcript_20169/m.29277 type:complete len:375 (-) Transcript_20169:228-1352(-)